MILLASDSRAPFVYFLSNVPNARAAVGAVALRGLGLPAAGVARALGVTPIAVLRGIARGEAALRRHRLDLERVAREALKKVN